MVVESVCRFAVCCQCVAFVLPLLKGSAIIYSNHEILAQMISVSFPFRLCDKLLLKSFVQHQHCILCPCLSSFFFPLSLS